MDAMTGTENEPSGLDRSTGTRRTEETECEKVEGEIGRAADGTHTGRLVIVGIGASAGGLEALNDFVAQLPSDINASFVVIQHMSSTYRSMLVELLQRKTPIKVQEARDGILPRPNTIYVTPPSSSLVLQHGRFRLRAAPSDVVPKPSIDAFFTSLAEEKGEDAIGVILSGTGSDGAKGMRLIKVHGGMCFAQEPSSAKYNGMPLAAIDTGVAHRVLPPGAISTEIAAILDTGSPVRPPVEDSTPAISLTGLLAKVRRRTSVDFSGYKEGTLWRRIKRRMVATRMENFAEYASHVEHNPEEIDELYKDILISVTDFFRDREAFKALRATVAEILSHKEMGEELRIWVPGCATGEEAYSIAILVAEEMAEHKRECRVQIFATDIDADAMATARRGVYAASSMEEMREDLIRKYFTPINSSTHFEVSRRLRDMVVFARQDLTRDPPFLRLDLISCRNVLIYFASELQLRVLSVFHYALVPHGYLFLGRSEGVYHSDELFEGTGGDAKLYRRRAGAAAHPPAFAAPAVLSNLNMEQRQETQKGDNDLFAQTAAAIYVPPAVLVDNHMEIRHVYGEVTPFLSIASGSPRFELLHLLRPEFRAEVQPLILVAQRKNAAVYGKSHQIKGAGSVRLAVHPVKPDGDHQFFMVAFEAVKRRRQAKRQDDTPELRELEEQLIATRENLQTMIEELETSNEEMQALNEELQASNEELQSSNEELEASNEELQSTNEELTTVNEEMRIKSQELSELNAELQSVENSIGQPLLVVDRDLKLVRYNRAAQDLFRLTSESRDSRLRELELPDGLKILTTVAAEAMSHCETLERSRIAGGGRIYTVSAAPFLTATRDLRGAIVTLSDTTAESLAEDKVRRSRQMLLSIMDHSPSLVALKDLAGRYTFVNERYAKYFDVVPNQIIGKTDEEAVPKSIAASFREHDLDAVRKRAPVDSDDEVLLHGEEHYLASTRFPLMDEEGHIDSVCTQAIDVTARVQAQEQLRLAARVFEHSGEGILVTDQHSKIVTVNDAFTRITGYTPAEAIGQTPALLRSGKHDEHFYAEMWQDLCDRGWWQGEVWNRRKDGSVYMEWLTINAVRDREANLLHYIGVFSDIEAVREGKDRLSYLATHDDLTGLANRTLFQDRVQQLITQGQRIHQPFAVLFIDLDDFKLVNDSAGHAAGDRLLIEASQRLRDTLRDADTVCRLGGDEFAVLARLEDPAASMGNAAGRILKAFSQPFKIAGRTVQLGASIGISVYPEDGTTVEALLKAADTAMYQAKGEGRNTYRFFSSDLRARVEMRMALESELRHAIEKGEFALHYQPRFDLASGAVVGIEALLRWEHPERGLVYPDKFIGVLEDSGLIVQVGEWVIKQASEQATAWRKAGLTDARISVNVSARQFQAVDFPTLLRQCQTAGDKLELELTETVLMIDPDSAAERMAQLREHGLTIAVDDFGTGYSSLRYLKEFPINVIKLDRSFVHNLPDDDHDAAIAKAVVEIAHALDLRVVAEGVENIAQAKYIKQLGCHELQGFLASTPLSAAELSALLARQAKMDIGGEWAFLPVR